MINKYLSLLIYAFLASQLAFGQSFINWNELPIEKKVLVLNEYKEFLIKHEALDPLNNSSMIQDGDFTTYFKKMTSFLILDSWAADLERCLIGGWPSYRNPTTKSCDAPFESENYPKDSCPSNAIACNPILFGDNLCSPFVTKDQRNSVFKNCEKQFKAEKRDMKNVAENVDPLTFKQMTENVDDVCNDTKTVQSKTGMCAALKNKLEEWVPNETLNSQGLINKAIRSKDIDDLIRAQESNQREIENNTSKFEANCEPEIVEAKQQICENLSAKIVKGTKLAERLATLMDQYQFEQPGCSSMQTSEVDALVSATSSAVNTPSCSQATKDQNKKQCSNDIACATMSSIPLASVVGEVMGSSCVNSQNSCLTHLITQCVKTFISNMGDMWDMLKSGAKWVGKKAGEFWDWMTGAEDAAADKQHQINNMTEQDQKSFLDDPAGYLKTAMNEIWEGTKEYLKNDIFCAKWSGPIPRTGTCIEPVKDFDCMTCKQTIEGSCAAMGVIVAEVVPAFVGGFAFNAASKLAKGGKAGSMFLRTIKASKKIAKIGDKISDLSDVNKFVKYGTKAFTKTWKHTKEFVDLSKKSISHLKKGLTTIKKHKSYSKIVEVAKKAKEAKATKMIGQGYDASVGKVVKVMDKADELAFKAGSATADATIGTIVKTERAADVINAVDVVSDSSHLQNKVSSPTNSVQKSDPSLIVEKPNEGIVAKNKDPLLLMEKNPVPEPKSLNTPNPTVAKKEPLLLLENNPKPKIPEKIQQPSPPVVAKEIPKVSDEQLAVLEGKSRDQLLLDMQNITVNKVIPKEEELKLLRQELEAANKKTPDDYINEYKANYPKESKAFSEDQIKKWGSKQAELAQEKALTKVKSAEIELKKFNDENDILEQVYKKKTPEFDPVADKAEELKTLENLAKNRKASLDSERMEMWAAEIDAQKAAEIAKYDPKPKFEYSDGKQMNANSRRIDQENQANKKWTGKDYADKKRKFEESQKTIQEYDRKIAELKGEPLPKPARTANETVDLEQSILAKEKLQKDLGEQLYANTQRKFRTEKNKEELYDYMKKHLDRADDPDVQKKMAQFEEEMIKLDKKEKQLEQQLSGVKKTPEEQAYIKNKDLKEVANNQKDMDKKIADAKWEMERREIEVKEKNQKFKEMDGKISESWEKNQTLRGYKNQKDFAEQDYKKAKNDYETLKNQSKMNKKILESQGENIVHSPDPSPKVMLTSGKVSSDHLMETSYEMKIPNQPDIKVSAINASNLPDNHPLKSQLKAMERQGVSIVVAPADAKFPVSYNGEQIFQVKNPKTGEMTEVKNHVITIKQEILDNPQSAKKLLAHEMGHKKTFTNNANYQNSLAKAENGEVLPYRDVAKDHKYSDFAAADESHQYFKQGYRELRQNGLPESQLQAKFKKDGHVTSEMIFGKKGVDEARWTFNELKEFSYMEASAHKLAAKQLNLAKDKPLEILNSFNKENNRFELSIDQSGSKFKKSFSIDEKKYPELSTASGREKINLDYEKKRVEAAKKYEDDYRDELNDPEVKAYIVRQSAKDAEVELLKEYPVLKDFSKNFSEELIKRSNHFEKTSKTTDEVNEMLLRFKGRNIKYQEYYNLRQRLGEINRELRP